MPIKLLDKIAFGEIQSWIHLNAKQIELKLWQFSFEHGSPDEIVRELFAYQNADGGFGHALKPDISGPDSSLPVTLYAMRIMQIARMSNHADTMTQNILRYIESAGLAEESAAFALLYANRDTALYQKALSYTAQLVRKLSSKEPDFNLSAYGLCTLTEAVQKSGLQSEPDFDALPRTARRLVNASIQRDPAQWKQPCIRPSDLIRSPESPYYQENAEIVRIELNDLIETRPEGGVWDVFPRLKKYERKSVEDTVLYETREKAQNTIWKMRFLRNFGRIL